MKPYKEYNSMNRKRLAALGAALATATVLVAGCATATEEQVAHADQIKQGMTKARVLKIMGDPPSDTQMMRQKGWNGKEQTYSCLYWGIDLQVCFDNGRVSSVNNY